MKSDLGVAIAVVLFATTAAVVLTVLVMVGLERVGLLQKLLCGGPWVVMLVAALSGLGWACARIRRDW